MLETIMRIAIPILTIIFGALSAYFRVHDTLRNRSIKYIAEAEELYKDSTKAGKEKFSWVVEGLYDLIPAPFRIILTKKCIENIVQSSFDAIEDYAKMQLDIAIEKYRKYLNDGKSGNFIEFIKDDSK